jgi:hypothetical protein
VGDGAAHPAVERPQLRLAASASAWLPEDDARVEVDRLDEASPRVLAVARVLPYARGDERVRDLHDEGAPAAAEERPLAGGCAR